MNPIVEAITRQITSPERRATMIKIIEDTWELEDVQRESGIDLNSVKLFGALKLSGMFFADELRALADLIDYMKGEHDAA